MPKLFVTFCQKVKNNLLLTLLMAAKRTISRGLENSHLILLARMDL